MADAPLLPYLEGVPWEAPEYVRDVLGLVTESLGAALPAEVNELFTRMAMVNSTKQSELPTVSSSSLFIAAVLWGRENGAAPSATRGLARAVEGSAFNSVFIPEVPDGGFAAGLAAVFRAREYDRTKDALPALSDSLRRLLELVRGPEFPPASVGKAEAPSEGATRVSTDAAVTVEAILVRLFEPEVIGPDLNARLRVARLEAGALADAVRRGLAAFLTGSTQFADDRPQRRRDRLGRGALAFAIAHLMCRNLAGTAARTE